VPEITAYPVLSPAAANDTLVIVDENAAGGPSTKQVTVGNLVGVPGGGYDIVGYGGADPTGGIDAAPAIAATITAAAAAAGVGGNRVTAPAGTFLINSGPGFTINTPGLVFAGASASPDWRQPAVTGTILSLGTSFTGTSVFTVTASQVSLTGFTINAAATTYTAGITAAGSSGTPVDGLLLKNVFLSQVGAVILQYVTRSVIEDVIAQATNTTTAALSCSHSTIIYFSRCNFAPVSTAAYAWYFTGCETIIATGCQGNNNPAYSLYLTGTNDSTFTDFEANGGSTASVQVTGCTDIRFASLYASGPSTPTYVSIINSSIIQVLGGWLNEATSSAVVIDGTGGAAHDVTISGMLISTSTGGVTPVSITATNVYSVTVTGNSISGPTGSTAAWLTDNSTAAARAGAYTGNTITNLSGGVSLSPGPNVAVVGNAVSVAAGGQAITGGTDWINVTVFGADPSGGHDSTTVIQAAITAAKTSGAGVYFPAGTYKISASLNVGGGSPGAVTICGDGWESQIFLANSSNAYIFDFGSSGPVYTPGLTIRDLYLNCNGTNQTSGGGGIFARGAVWCVFDHLWIEAPWGEGLRFYQDGTGSYGHHNTVQNCLFKDGRNVTGGAGLAMRVEQADENRFIGCTFQDCGSVSAPYNGQVHDTSAGNSTYLGCAWVGGATGASFLKSDSNPGQLMFSGCSLDGPNTGNMLDLQGTGHMVTGCNFINIGQGATSGQYAAVFLDGAQAQDCVISGCSFAGLNAYATAILESGGANSNNIGLNNYTGTWLGGAPVTLTGNASRAAASSLGLSPGGTTAFLRADGNWAAPPGGGVTPPAGDIGGTVGTPTVVSTHLSAALPVAQGGTGDQSLTTYAPLVGGATAAGPVQQVTANMGTAGTVLTSQGTGTLPTWSPAAGSTTANNIASATTTVNVSSAAAPASPFGQALTATSATTAIWQPSTVMDVTNPAFAGGAQGNGTHDDGPAILAAMNAASAADGVVYFPATSNWYNVANPVVLSGGSSLTLQGDGYRSVIKAAGNFDIFDLSSLGGLTITSLRFDSNATGTATAGAALNLTNCANMFFTWVQSNNVYNGLVCAGTNTITMFGCFFHAVNAALWSGNTTTAGNAIHAVASQFGGGSYGAILDSLAGSCSFVTCAFFGPLSLLTRNSLGKTSPNKGLTFFDSGSNYEAGNGAPPEGAGGFNLNQCAGNVILDQCWNAGAGLVFGGGVACDTLHIIGGEYGGAGHGFVNAIWMQGASTHITVSGAKLGGTASSSTDNILIGSAVDNVVITGNQFIGTCNYCVNSTATGVGNGEIIISENDFTGVTSTAGTPVNFPSGSAASYNIHDNTSGTTTPRTVVLPGPVTVAAPSGGTGSYLNATGQWTAPAGTTGFANPMQAAGDLISGGASPPGVASRLQGNTTSASEFLNSTGSAGSANPPAWKAIQAADLPAATTGAQGAVQLAGDLGGTGAAPTVTSVAHVTAGTLPVARGGTGDATLTAWAPLAGGTTAGNPVQQCTTNMSTAGTVLTSTGASSLPTWQTPSGSTTANALASATTTVNVSSAAAPTANQVLTATSGTAATWQTPSGGGGSENVIAPASTGSSSHSLTFTAPGTVYQWTLTGAPTFTFPTGPSTATAVTITLYITAGGGAAQPAGWTGVTWLGGVTPVINLTAGAVSVIVCENLGSSSAVWYGSQAG